MTKGKGEWKTHSLRVRPRYKSDEAVTYCGLRGWSEGGCEYTVISGDRFEVDDKPTCGRCRAALAKATGAK